MKEFNDDIRNRLGNHLKIHGLNKNAGLDIYDGYMTRHNGKEDLKGFLTEGLNNWVNDGRPNGGGWSASAIERVLDDYFQKGHEGYVVSGDISVTAPCAAY